MSGKEYFGKINSVKQKQYDALRMYFMEGKTAKEVAEIFGYKHRGFTTIIEDFNKHIKENTGDDYFFKEVKKGRKVSSQTSNAKVTVINLRKKYHSVDEIKTILDSTDINISESTIYNIIKDAGFSRLPRRSKLTKNELETPKIKASKSEKLPKRDTGFKSKSAGILSLLPYIKKYKIDQAITQSEYPGTKTIGKLNSILSFVALKASDIKRYSQDDKWCMDRGLGLFAGLNVLPKAAWFTSYSHRVTSNMNINFLKSMQKIWVKDDLLGDTSNLDFTTIPYWGNNEHLENNWSGKRTKALPSMLAVLAHDPDTGIINYGNTNVVHKDESNEVLSFLDFYHSATSTNNKLRYIVFDSKFTNYQNLNKLDKEGIRFITIRRRGKKLIDEINQIPAKEKKSIRVEMAGNKKRTLKVYEQEVDLKDYNGKVRQISITGHGKIKPAIIITNDFDISASEVVRRYARRWIVEKAISEQIDFFHLNSVSSSMVIKVDFDLTMSILTHNIFRLFAKDMDRYSHLSDRTIFDKFLSNTADIEIKGDKLNISLKKKRDLPLILEKMQKFDPQNYQWINNYNAKFLGASYS